MIFLKLFLSSGLMFIAETAFVLNESSLCYQPSKYIKPIHYDIKLILYIEGHIFYGEYNISLSIFNKTKDISLHSENISIKDLVLFKNVEKYENYTDAVYQWTYNIKEDKIIISFPYELSPGNYLLNIKYHGIADEVFRIYDVKEKLVLIAATHFHIIEPRRLPSCWDQQNSLFEATFNISIGCSQCMALSNVPLRNTEQKRYNMLWTHFDTTYPMSPYLATIIVSNYLLLRVDNDTQNIQMWCRNDIVFHMEFAKNVAENITLFYKNKWNQRSNSISKVTHVAIPNFHDNGIIVFGLVFYNENNIIYDKNLYHVARKIEVAQIVGHKVTEQWFYNLNNPFRSASWLNKALTTLLATYAVNEIYPDNRVINLFVVQNQHTSFYLDEDYHMWKSTSPDDTLLKIRESIRAPFILRMMQYAVTEEIFWKGIRSYANSTQIHRQSFTTFLEEVVADAKKLHIDISLSLQTMQYWTLEEQYPIIKVERDYNFSWHGMDIFIQNYDILKIDCLPVTFTIQKNPNFNNFTQYTVCKPKNSYSVYLYDDIGWVIFNIQQIGYYRVNYDDENWQRISNYLNSDNFTKIHVLNRAQIIDDAFHLMIAGYLKASIFWNITSYLGQEEDYIAWYPMFKALEYMFNTFPASVMKESNSTYMKRIKTIFRKVLKIIKYEEIDDIDELRICLRQEAAKWACFLGEIDCMEEANNKLKQHLNDSMTHRLLPWWMTWTYCRGLMITTRNETTFGSVFTIGLEKPDIKFSEYLACIEDTYLIKDYLNHTQHIYTKQENQFAVNTFLHIITRHAKDLNILTYILENFNEIKPKNVNIIAALIIMINNVYSKYQAESIEKHSVSIVEANVIKVNNTGDQFRRHRIKEMSNNVINKNYLYFRIKDQIDIRKGKIERQRQYSASYFF